MKSLILMAFVFSSISVFAGPNEDREFKIFCNKFPATKQCYVAPVSKLKLLYDQASYCNATIDECEETSKYFEELGCVSLQERAELLELKAMPICVYNNDRYDLKHICKCAGIIVEEDDEVEDITDF